MLFIYACCIYTQVLYKQKGMPTGTLYSTNKRSIELPLRTDGEYVVEVRAHTEGGDGAVAQISAPPGNSQTRGRTQNYSTSLLSIIVQHLQELIYIF